MRRRTTKLFVDSRFAAGGTSGSSILYEIPDGIELGPRAKAWVSEFTCVAAWNTIDESNRYQTVVELGTPRVLAIPTGAHDLESLRAALEEQLGAGYSVQRVSSGTGGSTFRQFRVDSLTGNPFRLPESPLSKIVRFPTLTDATSHVSGFVDLRRCHNIFVHSPSFGNYNTVGPRGVRTCLCKIPVDTGYGGLVRWQTSGSEHDYIECGVRSMRMLRLELRDSDGTLLDLAGTSFSMTLLFSDE